MAVSMASSSALTSIIIGLISSFGSILLITLLIFIFWATGCAGSGRILLDRLGRPGEYDDEQAFLREEAGALETMDDMSRAEYLRAKAFVTANPPESLQTEISLSQYLAIQEKGVSAWEFEPELEIANCFVEGRTEIEFFDSECTVMTNLPVPKQNDVYYWEAKIYEKPENTMLSIGLATKPYPLFRLPGFHKFSVGYQSDGCRRYNQPFSSQPYGPPLVQGDVVGIGYRPRSGAVFFTRNGKKLEEVFHGVRSPNFFPTIGAIGPAIIHVNFGQAGFVFIEANVKKWGLAPVTGSLAPPPPYGSEQGSILLEIGAKDGQAGSVSRAHSQSISGSPFIYPQGNQLNPQHGRSRSGNFRLFAPTSPGPVRSPTDISLAQLMPTDNNGESSSAAVDTHQEPNSQSSLQLQLEDATNPPPDYTSPDHSDSGQDSSSSVESNDNTPLIAVLNRSRGVSSASVSSATRSQDQPNGRSTHRRGQSSPQIPSYTDAVRQGAIGQSSAPPPTHSEPQSNSREERFAQVDEHEDEHEHESHREQGTTEH